MIGKIIVIVLAVALVSIVIYDNLPIKFNDIQYGVNAHVLTSYDANLVDNLGASWVRLDYNSGSQQFNQAVQNAETHDLNILAILDHWSVPEDFTYSEWNATVRNAVLTYPQITTWEVWNEPDMPASYYGLVNGSALQYFTLLKYTYQTIKEFAPNDIVIGLGGYNIPINAEQTDWLLQLESYGAFNYMNAVSLHLSVPEDANETIITGFYVLAQGFINTIKSMTTLPIWITEAGAGSYTDYYINSLYSMFIKEGIKHIFWYDLTNDGTGLTPNYGLLTQTGAIKQSYYNLQSFIEQNN